MRTPTPVSVYWTVGPVEVDEYLPLGRDGGENSDLVGSGDDGEN